MIFTHCGPCVHAVTADLLTGSPPPISLYKCTYCERSISGTASGSSLPPRRGGPPTSLPADFDLSRVFAAEADPPVVGATAVDPATGGESLERRPPKLNLLALVALPVVAAVPLRLSGEGAYVATGGGGSPCINSASIAAHNLLNCSNDRGGGTGDKDNSDSVALCHARRAASITADICRPPAPPPSAR